MHVATQVMLGLIAGLSLMITYGAPKRIGRMRAVIPVGQGLQVILLMGVILLWIIMLGATSDNEVVRLIASIMVAERIVMMIRYAGWIGQAAKIITWRRISFAMFWSLADAGLATTLLILTW